MKSNKEMFDELLLNYRRQKKDHEQKNKLYIDVQYAWIEELEANGETEKALSLGKELDKVSADLNISRMDYDILAHQVLNYYELL